MYVELRMLFFEWTMVGMDGVRSSSSLPRSLYHLRALTETSAEIDASALGMDQDLPPLPLHFPLLPPLHPRRFADVLRCEDHLFDSAAHAGWGRER